ncbi:MAG: hypothetical protein IJB45_06135 [Clostridia bacterium]|nr:hypothetical protein [Clostridia bacterium]
MVKIISFIMGLLTALSLASEGIKYGFSPTLEIDASVSEGKISSRASGFLYGLAESGVPDPAIVESIDVASVSQKVIDGLQHPVGDINNVAGSLKNCDYLVVYLQDCYDTWYYCHQQIAEMRANGTYDCEKFVDESFLPQVAEMVTKLNDKDYSDRLVYCPYNECDNTVWFGTPYDNDAWYAFDDTAKLNFYKAWEKAYRLIRSIDTDALIGGPGYCDYDAFEIEDFLKYCKDNNCLPDIMIYHELGVTSSLFWQDHIDEYRDIEKKLGISEMPIIITEYGTMEECGNPADMLHYVVKIEQSGTYANAAFWRLANNLCDTAADNNSPNSNWWLFRWYADMEGSLLQSKIVDILHSDFANVIKYNRDKFHYSQLTGMGSMTESKDKIEILCGGCDYTSNIVIKNLDASLIGKNADIKIECVYYEGLSGIVSEPVTVKEYSEKICFDKIKISLESPDPSAVYHIVVTANGGEETEYYENTSLPVRYEFENGVLGGTAYTYDSAYATTGQTSGMVGGLEHDGDSVTVSFDVPESGEYELDIIFGNSNDGKTPDERKDSLALLTLDGNEETISLPNTIKSEYTDKYIKKVYLQKGSHTLSLAHKEGTFVVDSMLIKPYEEKEKIAVIPDGDRTTENIKSFLAVAPNDGYYTVDAGIDADFTVDGAYGKLSGKTDVFLRRGLNYIDIKTTKDIKCVIGKSDNSDSIIIEPAQMSLSGGAVLKGSYVEGISSDGGKAEFTVNAPEAGSYRMTVLYSNNDEGGVHSYNVDLIERYITVNCKGKAENLWCRNTFSWDTFKTVTLDIVLEEGENTVVFSNDGSENFVGRKTFAPYISTVTVNKTVK